MDCSIGSRGSFWLVEFDSEHGDAMGRCKVFELQTARCSSLPLRGEGGRCGVARLLCLVLTNVHVEIWRELRLEACCLASKVAACSACGVGSLEKQQDCSAVMRLPACTQRPPTPNHPHWKGACCLFHTSKEPRSVIRYYCSNCRCLSLPQ